MATEGHNGDLWGRGVPLSEARRRFASPEMRKRYEKPKLRRKLRPKSGWGMLAQYHDEDGKKDLLKAQRLQDQSWGRTKAIEEMQASLLKRLQRGTLVALGFREGASISAPPERIPSRLLELRNFHWGSDCISAAKYQFVQVRIARLSTSTKKERVDRPKRGRPSIDGLLKPLVRDLRQKGQFTGRSQKEKIGLVRDAAQRMHPVRFPKKTQPSDTKIIGALKAESE
jgi:hypothetical protein